MSAAEAEQDVFEVRDGQEFLVRRHDRAEIGSVYDTRPVWDRTRATQFPVTVRLSGGPYVVAYPEDLHRLYKVNDRLHPPHPMAGVVVGRTISNVTGIRYTVRTDGRDVVFRVTLPLDWPEIVESK